MILSFLLAGSTLTIAGYSLKAAYIVRALYRDTRPLFMAFFLLMPLTVLEITLTLSPEVIILSIYFITVWISIEVLLAGYVGWLIILFAVPRRVARNKLDGIINE